MLSVPISFSRKHLTKPVRWENLGDRLRDFFFFNRLFKEKISVAICVTNSRLGFACGSAGKESMCNAGDLSWIPGLGRSPGEGKGYPLQYSGLENSMESWGRREWDTTVRLSLTGDAVDYQ